MAIKPFPDPIPSELPPAKLYLDDIDEIIKILTDSSPDCQASFVVGKSKCDTLDDLKDLRGRTNRFVLNISSPGKHQTLELTPSATRIHIHEIGDPLPAWSKYVNVAAIFKKRRLRLKSFVRSAAAWVFAAMWLVAVAVWIFAPHVARPISIHKLPDIATGFLLAVAVVYYFVSSHSIVYLRHPQKVGVGRWLEDHKPEIIVGAVCSVLTAVAVQLIEKGWK